MSTEQPTGQALNSLIAERIMGWMPDWPPDEARDSPCADEPCWMDMHGGYEVRSVSRWHPSSEIADAWLVVERMMSLGYRYVLRGNFEGSGKHSCGFDGQAWADVNPLYQSPLCDSLPLAICYGALGVLEKVGAVKTALSAQASAESFVQHDLNTS